MHRFPTPRSFDSVVRQIFTKGQSEVVNQALAHPLQSGKDGDINPHGKISNGKNVSENKQYCQVIRLEVAPHGVGTTHADSSPNFTKQGHRVKTEHWKFVRPDPVFPDKCVKWPEFHGFPVCEFGEERLNGESCMPSLVRVMSPYGVWHDPFHRLCGCDITYSFLL